MKNVRKKRKNVYKLSNINPETNPFHSHTFPTYCLLEINNCLFQIVTLEENHIKISKTS